MGRKYRLDPPDVRSAVYVISIGASGSGKDHPRKCVRAVLRRAGLDEEYLGGETIASGSAVLSALAQHPCRLFQIDEFGQHVQAMMDVKSGAWHKREVMTQLTTLWSSASDVVMGVEYANKKERQRVDIVQPLVCVNGSTVPQTFWDAMQEGNLGDGSIARFLVMETPVNYPDLQKNPKPLEAGIEEIAEDITRVHQGASGHVRGNLSFCVSATPDPYTVPVTQAAREALSAVAEEELLLKRKHENTKFNAVVARFREQVMRVALIAAVADDPAEPRVTEAHVEWAERLVRHCTRTVIAHAKRYLAESEHHRQALKTLEALRRKAGDDGWLTGDEVARCTKFLRRKERNEILADLAEMGMIETKEESTSKRPKTLVRVCEAD
jgi:hypothetical protein